jgi:hypothetical protein
MTCSDEAPNAVEQWRATIDALTIVAQAADDERWAEVDSAEAEEIRRLIMVHIARRRHNALPAAWVRRPGIAMPVPAETEPAPEAKAPGPDKPVESRPVWRD